MVPVTSIGRPVTVDQGSLDDVFPGARVVWLHVPRGGYGFILPVEAEVVSHGGRPSMRVKIQVETRVGKRVNRVVDAENLRWPR